MHKVGSDQRRHGSTYTSKLFEVLDKSQFNETKKVSLYPLNLTEVNPLASNILVVSKVMGQITSVHKEKTFDSIRMVAKNDRLNTHFGLILEKSLFQKAIQMQDITVLPRDNVILKTSNNYSCIFGKFAFEMHKGKHNIKNKMHCIVKNVYYSVKIIDKGNFLNIGISPINQSLIQFNLDPRNDS